MTKLEALRAYIAQISDLPTLKALSSIEQGKIRKQSPEIKRLRAIEKDYAEAHEARRVIESRIDQINVERERKRQVELAEIEPPILTPDVNLQDSNLQAGVQVTAPTIDLDETASQTTEQTQEVPSEQ